MMLCPERRHASISRSGRGRPCAAACPSHHWTQVVPYVKEIREFIAEIGHHAEQRSVYLRHEVADMTARRAEIEAHLHSTTVLQERLVRFQPEIVGSLQCPRCWVDRETRSSLTEAPSMEKEDSFRCQKCGFDLSIPFRK
jgi:hypothetical protein